MSRVIRTLNRIIIIVTILTTPATTHEPPSIASCVLKATLENARAVLRLFWTLTTARA